MKKKIRGKVCLKKKNVLVVKPLSPRQSQMVVEYFPFIEYLAKRLVQRLPLHCRINDLISVSVFGLVDALNKFNPEKGARFKTYAEFRIRGSMLEYLRDNGTQVHLPRSVFVFINQLGKVTRELEKSLIREPREEEIIMAMGMSEKRFYKYQLFASHDTISWNEYIESLVSPGPEDELIRRDGFLGKAREQIKAQFGLSSCDNRFEGIYTGIEWIAERILCISALSDKTLYCFYQLIWLSKTPKDIASAFNDNSNLVCQLVKRARDELKKPRNLMIIKDFLNGKETIDVRAIFLAEPKRNFAGIISKIRADLSAAKQAN